MINNFNFHGNIYLNFGCKPCNTQPTAETNCGAYVKGMTLDFENNLLIFNIEGTIGTNVNMTLSITEGSIINTDCGLVADTYSISIDTFGSIVGSNGTIALNAYSDECTTLLCSESYSYITNPVEVPLEGNAVIYNPTIDTCNDTIAYVELLNGIGNGVSMNTSNGIVTVDAQTIESNMPIYIYYATCNGIISNLIFLFLGNPQGPQQMYSCSGNTCIEDANGQYDHPSCYGNCNGGGQPTMYSCSGENCVEDINGSYNEPTCNYECESITLLASITFDDIANSPVPGNDVNDWNYFLTTHNTIYEFLANNVQIIGNTIYFNGQKSRNTQFAYTDGNPNITSINIDGLTNLKDLRFYTQNPINIDISNNLELVHLETNANIVLPVLPDLVYFRSGTGSLDMSNIIYSTLLEDIVVVGNSSLLPTHITFNNSPNLNYVRVLGYYINNDTIQVDFSDLLLLDYVEVSNQTALTTVITTGAAIRELNLSSNVLTNVDFATNTTLERLKIYGNISQLDLTYNTNLNYLQATYMYSGNGVVGLSDVLLAPVNNLSTLLFYFTDLPDSVINYILANIAANFNTPGVVELNGPGMGIPTGQGIIDLNALGELGWSIGTNLQGLTMHNFSVLPTGITLLTSLSQWNTFFDLPTNGTPFTSISKWSSYITLSGGSNITIKPFLFSNNGVFNSITDYTNCVTAIENDAFNGNNLNNIVLPAAVTIGDNAFANTQTGGAVINIIGCTSLGSTSGDDGVFANLIGAPWITLSVNASLATNNGGNPDGDIQYLTSNNSVTVNYI